MTKIAPFPAMLAERYRAWRDHVFAAHQATYETLATQGQKPHTMVISCSDSRVAVEDILGGRPGDFFVHRNVANLVPPFDPNGDSFGTSAAIEFGICGLKVQQVLVLGHSQCGGVQNCYAQCKGEATAADDMIFVSKWLELMRPAFGGLDTSQSKEEQVLAMTHQNILNGLQHLLDFPFVAEAVNAGKLTLHGACHNIGRGVLSVYNPQTKSFEEI